MKKAIFSILGLLAFAAVGQAATLIFTATLTGAAERPTPNVSTATGSATLTIDDVTRAFSLTGVYTGLTSATNGSHIHGAANTEGVAPPIHALANTGGTTGTLSGSGTYTVPQLADLQNSLNYVNVHTGQFPDGEIRGQLLRIPEPGVFGLGLLGTLLIFRRRN
ncbi:MAG: CHRD domain-containing protein [Verrucomicrobiales bacterium]